MSIPGSDLPLSGDEVVVGVHASGVELVEGSNQSLTRNYCSNCKKKVHCYVKVDRETNEAIIHKTCKNDDCECKCRTHYACKLCGHLHPHGMKCNHVDEEKVVHSPETDRLIEELNKSYNKEAGVTKI